MVTTPTSGQKHVNRQINRQRNVCSYKTKDVLYHYTYDTGNPFVDFIFYHAVSEIEPLPKTYTYLWLNMHWSERSNITNFKGAKFESVKIDSCIWNRVNLNSWELIHAELRIK